jgi:hypothetical protein
MLLERLAQRQQTAAVQHRAVLRTVRPQIADYIAIGTLIVLILWAVARVYLASRRF